MFHFYKNLRGGILIGWCKFYISYGCSYINGVAAFRVPWGLQMLPAIFLFFMLFLLPESPRWLARKDRWEDCHAVLTWFMVKAIRTMHLSNLNCRRSRKCASL